MYFAFHSGVMLLSNTLLNFISTTAKFTSTKCRSYEVENDLNEHEKESGLSRWCCAGFSLRQCRFFRPCIRSFSEGEICPYQHIIPFEANSPSIASRCL